MDGYYWSLKVNTGRKGNYDPNQPRVPAGNTEGGQWTAVGGSGVAEQSLIAKPRKIYVLTPQQMKKVKPPVAIPSDDWFKERWKKDHHGKVTGWGMGKRNWIVGQMKYTAEYQRGIWQGRVDKARGLDYSEERNENVYNLGYYQGYTEYESNRRGWDKNTREWFDGEYVND